MKKDYKSIIWLRLDSIGDAILSSSMLPLIKENFSEVDITVVCQRHVAELYEACPFIDKIIEMPFDCKFVNHEQYINVISQIKSVNPDLLLNSVYALHHLSDLDGLDFIPKRYAFRIERKDKYTNIISHTKEWILELEKNRRFLAEIGIPTTTLFPQVWLTPRDLAGAYSVRVDNYIVLFAGVRTIERFYDRYWEALKGLDIFVVTLGSKKDYDLNESQLVKSGCKGINLSGKLTLKESIGVIKGAVLVVGGETGLAHAACAVGVPNIILLGGGHYGRFMPYSPLTTVVVNKMDCFKCNWYCKTGNLDCIRKIKPAAIGDTIRRVLK